MYASAMRYPSDRITPEAEKQMLLQMLLSMSGDRAGAIKYLEYVKQTLHPDAVHIYRRASFEHLLICGSNTLGCRSFNAPRKTFNARVLNSITSKCFTILRGPTNFRLQRTPGIFISLAQARPQATALIGSQKALIL